MSAESDDWTSVLDDPTASVSTLVEDLSARGAASDALRVLHEHTDPVERLMALYELDAALRPLKHDAPDDVVSDWQGISNVDGAHALGLSPGDIIRMPWARRMVGGTLSALGSLTTAICIIQMIRMMGAGIDPDVTAPEYVQGAALGVMMFAGGIALRADN